MASLSREISTDACGTAALLADNPATPTQDKYSYPCLDITKSYFAKAISSETTCLSVIAKISLVVFPIFIALIALEAAFDLIMAPIVFLANCIAGPQTVTAPPTSSEEVSPPIPPEAFASSGSHINPTQLPRPKPTVPPEEVPESPILPTPELVKPRNISKKRWDALSQEERVDTLARIASAKNSVLPPPDSMAEAPHSPRRSQRIASSPDRPTRRSYAEATMGETSSSEPTTPQKTRPIATNPPSIHEAHRRSKRS